MMIRLHKSIYMTEKKTTKKYLVIASTLIAVFLSWYMYYFTSLIHLSGDLRFGQITIGKYLKCGHMGDSARPNDNDTDMAAYCCPGLREERSYPSNNPSFPMHGDIMTCVK